MVIATNPNLAIALGAAHHTSVSADTAGASAALSPASSDVPVEARVADVTPSIPTPIQPVEVTSPSAPSRRRALPWILAGTAAVAAIIVGLLVVTGGGSDGDQANGSPAPAVEATVEEPTVLPAATPAESAFTTVTAGTATIASTPCVDGAGLVSTATAVDIEGSRMVAAVGGDLYLLDVASDCTMTPADDPPGGLILDDDRSYEVVALLGDRVAGTGADGGAILNVASNAVIGCDGLRSTVAFAANGTLVSFDRGSNGYDEYSLTADSCSLASSDVLPNAAVAAIVTKDTARYLAAAAANGRLTVSRIDGGSVVWTYGSRGELDSVDGMSACAAYICVLDSTAGDLVVLGADDGLEVGRVPASSISGGRPLRLIPDGDGWLMSGENGVDISLHRLDVS